MKLSQITTVIVFVILPSWLLAEDNSFAKAISSIQSDTKTALEQLGQTRHSIREAKKPLAVQLNSIRQKVENKRRELKNQQSLQDIKAVNLDKLEKEVKGRDESINYLSNLLTEYTRSFETRIHVAELESYQTALNSAKLALEDESLPKPELLEQQLKALNAGVDRFESLLGGHIFEGRVFTQGEAIEGRIGIWGPVTYFSAGPEDAGLATPAQGSLNTNLTSLEKENNTAIAATLLKSSGKAPLDPTLGDALAIAGTKETITEHIQKGGIWIYPILSFALLSFIVAAWKASQIRKIKSPDPDALNQVLALLREDKDSEAFKFASDNLCAPFGRLISSGVEHRGEGKRVVEEVLYERVLETQPALEKHLSLIQITAATAPLMGLLGTITGMINTFKLITVFGTGDARSLSSGISEALVTTEFGLIVAIPSLILYALLNRRVQGILTDMDKLSAAFLNGLPKKKDGGKPQELTQTEPLTA